MDVAEIEIGQLAPAFDLPRDGGGSVTLSDSLGKLVVVYFYPKDDSGACLTESVDFSALAAKFREAGVMLVGISPDSVKSHDRFKTKRGLSVVLASDENRATIEAYGLWVEKSMYGRAYMGVERATFLIGEDGRILNVWRKVRVKGHAEDVFQKATTR